VDKLFSKFSEFPTDIWPGFIPMHNQQIPARKYAKSQSTLQLSTGHYDTEDQNKSLQHREDLKSHLILCFVQRKYFLTRMDHVPLILIEYITLCLK